MKLKISIHEFNVGDGHFIGMNAGEYTGIFTPMPVSDEDLAGMQEEVQRRAEHILSLKVGDELPEGCDITLDEIKASIRENIIEDEEALEAS